MAGTRDPLEVEHTPEIALGEEAWIEVIRKMDEVYSDLLKYEVALEEKNAALEESQRFVLSVLASMSDLLLVCDREGRIEVVNRALVDFTGRQECELVGSSLFDLFADEQTRAAARASFAGHGMTGLADCELKLRAADGSPAAVSFNCMPRHNHRGALVGLTITGRPLGELRRAYRELHEAHEDLKRTQQQLLHAEKMASLGRLVAGVAHELNNPISFVIGNVHALERYADRLARYLDAVHGAAAPESIGELRRGLRIDRLLADLPSLIEGTLEGAERTRDIVDSLKRFSVLDREQVQPFNLTEVIERAVAWVTRGLGRDLGTEAGADPGAAAAGAAGEGAREARPQAPARALPRREPFRVDLDLPEGITLVGSPGRIQQVVMNLVQNAADATADQPRPRLAIAAARVGDTIEVRFEDNGPGLAPGHLTRCFEPFFTTKPVGKGTGLGLSISYGLVERHGGRLTVVNAPEGGAVFTLTLPLPRGPYRESPMPVVRDR